MPLPMALCLLLASTGLYWESSSRPIPRALLGLPILFMGLKTLLERLPVVGALITDLAGPARIPADWIWLPKETGLGSAACLAALGGYLLLSGGRHTYASRVARLLSGALLTSFGGIALAGCLPGFGTIYGWDHFTRISALTAFSFAALGCALLLRCWYAEQSYRSVIVITLVGTLLSLSVFYLNRTSEIRAFGARLKLDSAVPLWLLQKDIGLALRHLKSASAYVESSDDFTEQDFSNYIDKVAGKTLAGMYFEWVPIIGSAERKSFEDLMTTISGQPLRIAEVHSDGRRRPVEERKVYYPVLYRAPGLPHSEYQGLDHGSRTELLETLERALREDTTILSAPISWETGTGAGQGKMYFAVQPVHRGLSDEGPHIGLVTAAIDAQDFVDRSLSELPDIGLDLLIYDKTSRPNDVLVASRLSHHKSGLSAKYPEPLRPDRASRIGIIQELSFGGRNCTLVCIPTDRYAFRFTVLPWIALVVSFLMTFSTALFVYWLTDRSDRLRRTKRLLEIQTGVGRILNEDKPLEEIAHGVLSILCRHSPWSVGGFWLVGPSGLLHCSAFYTRPGEDYAPFRIASLSPDCHHDRSLIGRVWRSGRHEWIRDLRLTPDNLRREAALACGLASGIGFPIHIRQRVVGVVDLYSRMPQTPDPEFLHVVAASGATIGQYLLRRETQMHLESHREDLERVNLELDSFVYTASHDLRAPLRAIGSFSDFLDEDYGAKLDEQGRDYLAEIKKGVRRMTALIDDLLTLSRLPRIHNPYESVPMGALVREICDRLGFDIDKAGAQILIREDLPTILCDRIKMGELLVNLIGNAVKYSSKLTDRKALIEIGHEDRPAEHVFYVKDNGIGIEPKYQAQIFTMFKRLHTQEEYEGTGAGLSIVRRIIDEHRGRVWLTSEPDKGSTFFFSIPKTIREPIRTQTTP